MKVVLIDDDDIHNYIAKYSLSDIFENAEIVTFENPNKGLEYLESNTPDLILLDVNMNEMSGFDFLEEYQPKHISESRDTLVFMLSSSYYEKEVERSREYSCVKDYLVKPLDYENLKAFFK